MYKAIDTAQVATLSIVTVIEALLILVHLLSKEPSSLSMWLPTISWAVLGYMFTIGWIWDTHEARIKALHTMVERFLELNDRKVHLDTSDEFDTVELQQWLASMEQYTVDKQRALLEARVLVAKTKLKSIP